MEMDRKTLIVFVIAGFIVGFLLGFCRHNPSTEYVEVLRTDTLTVYDTVRIDRPVYITQRVVDSLRIPVTDTLRVHDTVYVVLERVQREYRDSLYTAWVSGVDPALDSIEVYQMTKVVTITETVQEPRKRWGFGVTAGYGAAIGADRSVTLWPFVGVGISYNFVNW